MRRITTHREQVELLAHWNPLHDYTKDAPDIPKGHFLHHPEGFPHDQEAHDKINPPGLLHGPEMTWDQYHEHIKVHDHGELTEGGFAPRLAGPKAPALNNDWMVNNVLDHYNNSTNEHKAAGAQWYPAAREYVKNIADKTNRDPSRAAAIMAAMSPQEEWERNIQSGTNFMLNYDPANPQAWHQNPNKPTQGTGNPGLGDNINRAIAVHHAPPGQEAQALGNGPKVQNFYRNLTGDDNAVTVDGHMAKAIMGEGGQMAGYDQSEQQLRPKDHYNQMADAVTRAAHQKGISPAQMQATVWLKYQDDMANQTKSTYESVHPGQAYEDRDQTNHNMKDPKYNVPDFTKGKELSQHPPGLDPEKGPMRPEQRVLPEPTYKSSPGYNHPYSQQQEQHSAPSSPEYNNLMMDQNTTPTGKPKTKGLWGPFDDKSQKWSSTVRENPNHIRTAREQVEMLAPWRTASDPNDHAYHTEPGEGRGEYNPWLGQHELDSGQEHQHEQRMNDEDSGYNWGPPPDPEPGPPEDHAYQDPDDYHHDHLGYREQGSGFDQPFADYSYGNEGGDIEHPPNKKIDKPLPHGTPVYHPGGGYDDYDKGSSENLDWGD